jgi:hypothetical protein
VRLLLVLGAVLLLALPATAAPAPGNGLVLLAVDPPPGPNGEPHGPVQLWAVAPRDGAVAREVGVAAGSWDEFADAAFSADGKSILDLHALTRHPTSASTTSLDSIPLPGGQRTVLLRRAGISQFAASPDGRRIAFVAYDRAGTGFSLYEARLPHGPVRTLVPRFDERLITWAGDGLVYTVCHGDVVCSIDPATAAERRLPLPPALLANQQDDVYGISPDASRIAMYVVKGPAGVRVFRRDGVLLRTIRGRLCVGGFSPDGTELLLADACGGTRVELSVFDFATRRLRPLHVTVPLPAGATDRVLDWQPRYP